MLCQNCGKREVNFRYTQIINGVKKEMALCDKCAKELEVESFDFNMPINLSSFLGDFLEEYEENNFLPDFSKEQNLKCPICHRTYEDFVNSGKFGCSSCYETFLEKIRPIIKNIQGSAQHVGRNPGYIGESVNKQTEKQENKPKEINIKQQEILELKEELKRKIKEENYEEAAKIRDKIKELEKNS